MVMMHHSYSSPCYCTLVVVDVVLLCCYCVVDVVDVVVFLIVVALVL